MDIEKIKEIMKQKNITQYRLTQMTGLSTGHVSRLLSGKLKEPTLKSAQQIAKALDVTIDEIVK